MTKNIATFVFKCFVAGTLVMFLSMWIGEFFVRPDLFGGFSHKPRMIIGLFIECVTWTIPFSLLGYLLLSPFKRLAMKKFTMVSAMIWVALSIILAVTYKQFWFPNKSWKFIDAISPEIVFGWIIPYVLFGMIAVYFSRNLKSQPSK